MDSMYVAAMAAITACTVGFVLLVPALTIAAIRVDLRALRVEAVVLVLLASAAIVLAAVLGTVPNGYELLR
ncbi:MAG: hypothetical protein ACTHNQ_19460 [Microbacterium sp.]|uniref:hypothetical protein n=1 Tax=Microbacterium sp. TaxID=51671 RepID=UPI003F7D432B